MSDQTKTFNRRDFIKISGMAATASLLAPSLLTPAWASTGEVDAISTCHFGVFRTKSKDGRLIAATPYEGTLHSNKVIPSMPDYAYSPARIKYPMVRKSYLSGGPGAKKEARGSEGFVRVSWDKATELIAAEMKRVINEHGNASILAPTTGWPMQAKVNAAAPCVGRLGNLMGGFSYRVTDYSTGAAQVIMPYVTGASEVYGQQTCWPTILEKTDTIVFWGSNPLNNLRIGWGSSLGDGLDWFKKLKESGKRIVVIDPRRSESAKDLNAEWLAPAPNTDTAIMLAMAYTLQEEGLVNQEFLDEYTVGYDKFLPYLLGKSDNQPKTPEWAAAISGIEADVIEALARQVAKNPSMLIAGWSLQRAHHGEQPIWMLVTLASMIGQIGQTGCGYSLGHHYSDGGSPRGTAPGLSSLSPGKAPAGAPPSIPSSRTTDAILNPGKTISFKGKQITYPDIKMLWLAVGNPQNRHPERGKMIRAWQKLDTVVVHEMFWTSSAWMADIVLPISTMMEVEDIYSNTTNTHIIPMKKAMEPLYESKPTYEAFAALAKALGVESEFTEGKSMLGRVEDIYNGARKQAKGKKMAMPEFKAFWEKGDPLKFPLAKNAETFVLHGEYLEDPLLEPLGTPSGKIEIFSRDIEKMKCTDCGPHPQWFEPFEWLGAETAQRYPLHMLTAHPKYRIHSQFNHVKALRDLYTVAGREPVTLNAEDAKARGIKDGDLVRIFNGRGQILAGAILSEDIRPSVIQISEGGWYDPVERGNPDSLCKYGNVNVLTKDVPASDLSQGNNGHTCLVQVEKYTAAVPAVTAFDPPKDLVEKA